MTIAQRITMKQNPITRRVFALSFIAITAILATPALWASDTLVAGQAGGLGLYFNGARQHAKFACPMIPGRKDGLTIEFWMRADRSTATVAGRQSIVALCGSTLVIQVEGINGENRLGLSGDGVDARSLAVLPDAQLHFVAVTCAPTELQLFVDGALKNTTKLARPLVFKGGDCIIGGFKGSVGPVTLWRGARTAAQIARDMLDFNTIKSPCLTGKEPDLIARIPLDEGAGMVFTDVTRTMRGTLENGAGWNKPIAFAPEPYSEGIWFVIQNKADLDTDIDIPARRLALTPDGKGGVCLERIPDKGDYDRFLWRAAAADSGRFVLVNRQLGDGFALECKGASRPAIASRGAKPGQLWTMTVANSKDWGLNAYFLHNRLLDEGQQRLACRTGKISAERSAAGDTAQGWVLAPMEVGLGYCLPRNPDVSQTPFTRRLGTGLGPEVVGTTTSSEWTFLNAALVLRNVINAAQNCGKPESVAALAGWRAVTWSAYDDRVDPLTKIYPTTTYPITKPFWDTCHGWGTYPNDRVFIMTESILMRHGPGIREFCNPIHEFAHALDSVVLQLDAPGTFGNTETFPWAVQQWFLAASELGRRKTRDSLSPNERKFLEKVFRPSNTWLPPRWLRTQQSETFELGAGDSLKVGDKLEAFCDDCHLTVQSDGNVVVNDNNGKVLWGSHQSLAVPLNAVVAAKMNADGSLVFLDGKQAKVWSSPACGAGARLLVMRVDPDLGDPPGSYLRIIARDSSVAWQSK